MKKILLSLAIFLCATSGFSQHLISVDSLNYGFSVILKGLNAKAEYDVMVYKIRYNTIDVNGNPTVASGALMLPLETDCDSLALVSYNHGTVLLKEDVPSRYNTEALIATLMASTGKVVIAPDYLGLGDNTGFHPYLHGRTEATATIDMIRAVREFVKDSVSISLNGEIFLTGYSQGGHAAMATAKYIKSNNLSSEFNVVAAAPASGAYNFSGFLSGIFLSNQTYTSSGLVCYLLFSYQETYGNIYNQYADILKPPYDTLIPPYFDGNYDMAVVNALLPNTASDFIQDTVLINFAADSINKNHPLWKALLDNDNFNWTPNYPMNLFYCTEDEVVDYKHSIFTAQEMTNNGAPSVQAIDRGALGHYDCVIPSLEAAINFFDIHASSCGQVGIGEKTNLTKVDFYPNPADDKLYFTIPEEIPSVSINLYNVSGVLLFHKVLYREKAFLSLSNLMVNAGMYIITIETEGSFSSSKLMIK